MPEITLRDIYQSQQELLGSFKEMQTEQKGMQTEQREMRGSFKEMLTEQQLMRSEQKSMLIEQREMRSSISDLKEAQQETLEALHAFATHVDDRFSQVDNKFKSIDQQFTEIRATMVTKDYLDNKIADLRGDLVLLARKGNTKLSTLVERLVEEKRLDPKVAHQILLMEPFPQS